VLHPAPARCAAGHRPKKTENTGGGTLEIRLQSWISRCAVKASRGPRRQPGARESHRPPGLRSQRGSGPPRPRRKSATSGGVAPAATGLDIRRIERFLAAGDDHVLIEVGYEERNRRRRPVARDFLGSPLRKTTPHGAGQAHLRARRRPHRPQYSKMKNIGAAHAISAPALSAAAFPAPCVIDHHGLLQHSPGRPVEKPWGGVRYRPEGRGIHGGRGTGFGRAIDLAAPGKRPAQKNVRFYFRCSGTICTRRDGSARQIGCCPTGFDLFTRLMVRRSSTVQASAQGSVAGRKEGRRRSA